MAAKSNSAKLILAVVILLLAGSAGWYALSPETAAPQSRSAQPVTPRPPVAQDDDDAVEEPVADAQDQAESTARLQGSAQTEMALDPEPEVNEQKQAKPRPKRRSKPKEPTAPAEEAVEPGAGPGTHRPHGV